MHQKHWLFLVGFVVTLFIAFSAFNSTWLAELIIARALASKKGIVVRHVHINSQVFSLPGRLELKKVDVAFDVNGQTCTLEMPQVTVTGLQRVLARDRRILVSIENGVARYALGTAKRWKADMALVRDGLSGPVIIAEVDWDKLRAKNASAFLMAGAAGVELRAIKFEAYGGKVTGKVVIGPDNRYAAEFLSDGVDLARLADVNPQIAEQLSGKVTGTVRCEGDAHTLRSFDAELVMPVGGRMSASLLAALTQYLPQSREKKRLDLLIRQGGKIGMEVFSLTMKGGEAGKFGGEMHMKSREINLDLNLTHEINTDGTLASLWAYWEKYLG